MSESGKRRILSALAVLTLLLLGADIAGSPATQAVRQAAGEVLGPLQRALAGAPRDESVGLRAEVASLRAQVEAQRRDLAGLAHLRTLLGSDPVAGHLVVTARVVGTEVSPLGGRSVTLDVGARDGVTADTTVVADAGLVGRVVSVTTWTSEVQVIGSFESVVAVRVGPRGLLGTVAARATGGAADAVVPGLGLRLAGPGSVEVGDIVTTLGSVGGRPYAPGITVGRVTEVAAAGQPGADPRSVVATVRPDVDPDTLDVVAVLVPQPRAQPRPSVTGGAG